MLVMFDQEMKPINALQVGDMKVRSITWAGNEQLLLTRSDTQELDPRFVRENAEFYNIMIIPVDPQKPFRLVFQDDPEIMNATFGWYGVRQKNGRWFAYVGGMPLTFSNYGKWYYEGGTKPALYEIDLSKNQARKIANSPSESQWRDWLIDEDGNVAATLEWERNNGRWTIKNGRNRKIWEGENYDGDIALLGFSENGQNVIYFEKSSAIIDDDRYFTVPLTGNGEAEEILSDQNVDAMYWSPKNSRFLGWRDDTQDDPWQFVAPQWQASAMKIDRAFSDRNLAIHQWTPDFQRIIVSTNGNNDSGSQYLVDITTLEAKLIGQERPKIGNRVNPISTFEYTAQDGLEIEAILTLPLNLQAENLPVIPLPHGGPHSQDSEEFDWWAQAFASRGYAVLQPNFRGSTNRDDAFKEAGYGEWGGKMQTDLSDGLNALADKGVIDPSRACIVGASYGGYAALAGVTLQHGIYKCAVAVAPVSDIGLFYRQEHLQFGIDRRRKANYLEEFGPTNNFGKISPRNHAEDADAPILLIHGRDDTVVPYVHSKIMADALKDAGKPYKMVDLMNEDHWLSHAETRNQMLHEAMDFVQKYNPAQ
ncbi:prolyl oligopeptidase family serine peptidase [Altererythrobacter endophyticus]|uniref:Prolyl oligopeptidase family serine peptidase n=2 Tax=Altericroceibacterium endophyticum TaxID=1808508 RepID=A0A6I4T2J2_9SPHN|nr:prolyl oligopeptidase family serine peptidase [Altericroceibacterium endophyticum]